LDLPGVSIRLLTVLKVISAYPIDGSYPYHCSWKPREYGIYNGVTQDLWYWDMVVPP
jgi:hypothetical protein